MRSPKRVPADAEIQPMVSNTANKVPPIPLTSVSRKPSASPGKAHQRCQAIAETCSYPSVGHSPKAGATSPASPSAVGPSSSSRTPQRSTRAGVSGA